MEKKIVLVDMDGVLCQYDEKVFRLAHERFGLPLLLSHQALLFDSDKLFPKEYQERIDAMANEEGFFKDLQPFPGVIEALHEMDKDPRLLVFICTAPKRFYKNPHCVSEKLMWGMKHLGKEWTDKVIITRDKTLVQGDVLIDDKPEVSGTKTPTWVHVYHDRPYNRDTNRPRISSWKEWRETLEPILFR